MQATERAQQAKTTTTDDIEAPFLDQVLEATVKRLELVNNRCRDELSAVDDAFRRAFVMAKSMRYLETVLSDEVMNLCVMPLMNTRMGFLTDMDPARDATKQPYPLKTVRRVIIEGLLRGVDWTGNRMNIIAGNLYITKEGYQHKIDNLKGVTDFDIITGIPKLIDGRQVVRMAIRWKLNGEAQELKDKDGQPGRDFAVIFQDRTSVDAMIGKATRKALKAAFDKITKSSEPADDDDDGMGSTSAVTAATAKASGVAGLVDKLAKTAANGTQAAKEETKAPAAETTAPKVETKEPPTETKADQAALGADQLEILFNDLCQWINEAEDNQALTTLILNSSDDFAKLRKADPAALERINEVIEAKRKAMSAEPSGQMFNADKDAGPHRTVAKRK